MRYLLPLLCFALIGCATDGTVLYNPNTGKRLAVFKVDMDLMTYNGGGVACTITKHKPSHTIAARGRAFSVVIGKGVESAKTFGGMP